MQPVSYPNAPSPDLVDYCNREDLGNSCLCGLFVGFLGAALVPSHPYAYPISCISSFAISAIGTAIDRRHIALHNEAQLLLKSNTELKKKLDQLSSEQSRNHRRCATNSEEIRDLQELIKKQPMMVIVEQPGISNQLPADCNERKNK